MEDLKCTLEVKGTNILKGLRQMCETSNGLVSNPPPSWIKKSVYRGRNYVYIKPKKPLTSGTNETQNARKSRIFVKDFDEMSFAGSEITVIHHK